MKGKLIKKKPTEFVEGMQVIIDDQLCILHCVYPASITGVEVYSFISTNHDSHYGKEFTVNEIVDANISVLVLQDFSLSETELEPEYWIKVMEADIIGDVIEYNVKENQAHPVVVNPLWDKELKNYLKTWEGHSLEGFKKYMEERYGLVKKIF